MSDTQSIIFDAASGSKSPATQQWLKNEKLGTIEKTASYNNYQDTYPTPFLNLSDMQIPNSTYEIFKWCKYFYTFDPLIAGAVNALAMFPITEIYFEDKGDVDADDHIKSKEDGEAAKKSSESDTLKFYKRVLTKNINVSKLLVEIGIDYYLYGNCFVFGEFHKNKDSKEIEWKSMIRLDPSRIIIDYNPATQDVKYKWKVPARVADIIKKKSPKDEYDKIPNEIKDAVKKNGSIILNPKNIYHFARPTDSMGENSIWGTPVIANVLKLLMYKNTLRQAQEAIAREHIVPFRVYYMTQTDNFNPMGDWNNAAESLAGELMKCVRDPNHKVVSPVPVGLVNVGGDGRALLVTPEIEQVQGEILAGMNVPREFIFGGVSYSGSSVALKILENQFITYRLLMEDFVQNFCIRNLAIARGDWKDGDDDKDLISVRFNDLKMQDDVQQKQLIIGLNSAGKIPDSYMFRMLGLEPDKMNEALKNEASDKLKADFEVQKLQASQNFELQKLQLVYDFRLRRYQSMLSQIFGLPEVPIGEDGNPATPDEGQIDVPGESQPAAQENPQEAVDGTPQNIDEGEDDITHAATNLLKLPKEQQDIYLAKLPNDTRVKVAAKMQELKASTPSGEIDMRPMPEQLPPRRDSLK